MKLICDKVNDLVKVTNLQMKNVMTLNDMIKIVFIIIEIFNCCTKSDVGYIKVLISDFRRVEKICVLFVKGK